MDTFTSLYYGGEFTHEGTNKTYQLIYFYGRYSILAITMHNKCIQICVDPNFKLFFVMEYWIFRLISQRSKAFLLNFNCKKYDNIAISSSYRKTLRVQINHEIKYIAIQVRSKIAGEC